MYNLLPWERMVVTRMKVVACNEIVPWEKIVVMWLKEAACDEIL